MRESSDHHLRIHLDMKLGPCLFLTAHADRPILHHDHLPGHGEPDPHTVIGLVSCLIKPIEYIGKVLLRDSLSVIPDKNIRRQIILAYRNAHLPARLRMLDAVLHNIGNGFRRPVRVAGSEDFGSAM